MNRSHFMAALAVAGAMFTGAALAAADIGNTTTIMTYPDGKAYEFHHKADGTLNTKLPDGTMDVGTWKLDGNTLVQTDSKGTAYKYDLTGDTHKVGDKWAGKDSAGKDVTLEMKAGE